MPQALIDSFIALIVILIPVSLLGFAGAATETRFAIEAYIGILGICTVGLLIQSAFVT